MPWPRALFKAGAKRIVFVESTQSRASLEGTLDLAGWDVKAFNALGDVQYENTRNLGSEALSASTGERVRVRCRNSIRNKAVTGIE